MTVKITVEEFVKNGGKMKKGRKLFYKEYSDQELGAFKNFDIKGVMWIAGYQKAIHPWGTNACYVEIEVKPIYK